MMRGLPPRAYYSLLPSQRDLLASSISALYGTPPRDFFESLERSIPPGVNPNFNFGANFHLGGRVLVGAA